jgi:hypothetical protein
MFSEKSKVGCNHLFCVTDRMLQYPFHKANRSVLEEPLVWAREHTYL